MKRLTLTLLLTLLLIPNADAAFWNRHKKAPKKPAVTKEQPHRATAAAPTKKTVEQREMESNRFGDELAVEEEAAAAHGKPASAGKGQEMRLTRAASKVFDLRHLPRNPPQKVERPEHEDPEVTRGTAADVLPNTLQRSDAWQMAPTAAAPAPIMNFDGLDFNTWGNGHPPDTVGDVGKDYFIQAINTSMGVYRKSDGVRVAAFTLNTFMSQGSFGNICDTNNFGDPVILYDTFEDRWIITDFAFQLSSGSVVNPPGAFQCFAVSMTDDPVSGGWNFYSINVANGLGDYPKFGIWPDGLYMYASVFGYMSGGSFQGGRAYALNKAQMYAGKPTVQVMSFEIPGGDFTVLPANARLQTGTPPAGTPNYFLSTWVYLDAITVYKFHVDWDNIYNSTFTGPDVPGSPGGSQWPNQSVANAPSLGGNSLDVLQIRAMMQNQYTNIGGVESLWATHTVRRALNGFAAPRWYQVNVTGGTVADPMVQGVTWDPDGADVMHRFMPSLAVNKDGDLALGYSTSSSTTKPALKYAGRLASDPVNTFSFGEQLLIQGAGTQTGNCGGSACTRWGDYAAMTLDPDGCTFWFTSMYYAADGLDHHTRIGSFAYPSCTAVGNGGTISGTVRDSGDNSPINGATVRLGSRTTTTNGSGAYSFSVPAGTYFTLTAEKSGFSSGSSVSIPVTDGGTTTRDFSLAATATNGCATDTTQNDFETALLTNIDTTTSANDARLVKPSLDQYNTQFGSSAVGFNSTTWAGQTFTPAVTGNVSSADLRLFCSGCSGTPQNLTVSIRATAAGLPTGADLASATLPGFISGSSAWYSVTFPTPAAVTAGTMYALVIRPNGALTGTYALIRSVNSSGQGFNVYAGGTRVQGATSGTVWSIPLSGGSSSDAAFYIYIDSGYAPNGTIVKTKDASPAGGLTPIWGTLSWTASTPANTEVKFQVAGSNSENGPFNFVGPDGTAATFFTNAAGSPLTQFYDKRFLQYKSFLATTDPAVTPTLSDVSLCFVNTDCSAPISITPSPLEVCDSSTGNTASGPAGATSYSWSITNGTITGGATSQTVTYTAGASGTVGLVLNIVEAGGCQKSASTNITINPIPPTPTITPSGATTHCSNVPLTLTSSSATGNQWYRDNELLADETGQTINADQSGDYTVTVTASGCTSAMSAPVTVLVEPAPAVPTISAGGPTTFCTGGAVLLTSSSATGNQWYLDGNPINTATSDTYSATASGSYTVVVTEENGCSETSAATVVTVNAFPTVPTITADTNSTGTQDQACPEVPLTLHANSEGATSYQWYSNNDTLNGETGSTLSATGAANYYVEAIANGCVTAKSAAYLVQNPTPHKPFVTANGPLTFCQGGSVTLMSDSATGIQWYKDNVAIVVGGGSQNYVATTSGTYTCQLNALGCHSVVSDSFVVTVNPIPTTPAITPGGPTTFCQGGSVTLTSSSESGNQWYLDGNPIGGEIGMNYVATASGSYTVKVTETGCTSPASAAVVVTVNPIPATPTITPGGPTTFCAGGSVTLTSSSASGNQWYLDGNPIGGQTAQQYVATASGNYTVVTTQSGCSSSASAATTVTVNPIPSTPTITPNGPTTFCTPGSVTLTSSSASGNQWYLNGNPISGATNQTYVVSSTNNGDIDPDHAPASVSGNYTVIVTTSGCASSASAAVSVTAKPTFPEATFSVDGGTEICEGQSVTFTANVSGNGITYQWYRNGSPIGGATNQTYIATTNGHYELTLTLDGCTSALTGNGTLLIVDARPPTPTLSVEGTTSMCQGDTRTLTASATGSVQWYKDGSPIGGATFPTYEASTAGSYTATTQAGLCTSLMSDAVVITVNPIPSTPTVNAGGPTTFCAGGSVLLTSSSESGNQWYRNGTPIGGATSGTYSATTSGDYTVVVTSNGCSSAPSSAATVVVTPLPATPSITGGTGFCTGSNVVLTSSSATGNQWYLDGNPIGGATSQEYTASAAGSYTVVVTASGCSSLASAAHVVSENPIPSTPTISAGGPTTFCAGGSVTLTSSSASGNQWYLNGNPIGGATAQQYVASAVGDYTVVVTTTGCSSAASAATTVTVNPLPSTPTISAGGPTTFCTGGSVTLTSSSASGNHWYLDGNPIGGATAQQYVANAAGNYTVVVTASGCSSSASAATVVTVNPIPPQPTISAGGPTTFCAGGSVLLTSSSSKNNQWFLNGNPIGGATNQTYTATASGNYTVVETTLGCSSPASAATTVTANPLPATPTISAGGPTTFCTGGSVTLTSSSASGNQWFVNGNPIVSATAQQYVANTAGDYTVVVTTSGCSSSASAATTVTINPIPSATITAPGSVISGSTGNAASVADAGAGATYSWNITNGTITAGTGTRSITFTAGSAGTLTLNVTVTANGCSDTKSANVTVGAPAVTVTSVTPNHGPYLGGTPVTIAGTGFAAGATVTFGGTAATNVVVVSATQITAKTPAHAGGAVNVTVTNTNTTTATLTNGYTYVPMQFDPNGDGVVDPADVFFLVNYLFLGGPAPHGSSGMVSGDANGDGVVDPADIFYVVKYLFLNGQSPYATTPRTIATNSKAARISGALSLGRPVARDGRTVIPVILKGGDATQALALKLRFSDAVTDATIRRAGAAQNLKPVFEISRPTENELSYLVAFEPSANLRTSTEGVVIAEVEVNVSGDSAVSVAIDPSVTMLAAIDGTQSATAANGNLELGGSVSVNRPRVSPKNENE